MFDTRFKLVGISVYGTPVLRVRNNSGQAIAIELHAMQGEFTWTDTVGTGDTFVELPDGAAIRVSSEGGAGRKLRPSASLPLHEGPIHKRAQRHAQGLPRNTRVRTLFGEVAVENLRIGDPVLCRDNEHRSLRWMARSGHGAEAVYYPLLGCNTQIATDSGWMPAMGPETALRELPGAERDALLAANPQLRFKADRRPALPALDPAEFSCRIELA
jgi:hypothetical protein